MPDEVVVHGPHAQEGGDGGHVGVQLLALQAVGEDQHLAAVLDGRLRVLAQLVQGVRQRPRAPRLVVQRQRPVLQARLGADGLQLVLQQHRAGQDHLHGMPALTIRARF